jgi:1-acyl-sn-glycerol-3-phosphate acyltransferase
VRYASRPPRAFLLARFLRVCVAPLVAGVFRTKVIGREHFPGSGGVVLAGNHISYADPVLLWCKAPRPVHFFAKSELWDVGWLAWGADHVWAFPVHRGQADRDALSRADAYLKAGELVGIFPEGTRNREGKAEGQDGAAFIALRAGAPIVPVGIAGTDRIRPKGSRFLHFPKVVISFGEAIEPESLPEGGRKQRVEALTGEIMRRIGEELIRAREEAAG